MSTSARWLVAAAVVTAMAGTASAQRRPPPGAPQPSPQEQQAVQQGLDAMFRALGGAQQQQQAAPAALIDHRQLKGLLPAELKGFKRTSASSERSGAMGMVVSRAEAAYERGGEGRIEIEFTDMGGLGGIAVFAQAAWMSADIDRETDDGFERTTQYKDLKAHEEYDSSSRSGKIEVLVGGRVMVRVSGSDVKFEDIRAALDQVDLAKIAALKPAEAK